MNIHSINKKEKKKKHHCFHSILFIKGKEFFFPIFMLYDKS